MKKVFVALKHYQDGIVLRDVFWIDETFVKKKPADMVSSQNGKHKKGLFRNLICVEIATDGYHSLLYVVGSGKPSLSKLIKAMNGHVKQGARMIDDDENAHSLLASRYGLVRETHPTREKKGCLTRIIRWIWSIGCIGFSRNTYRTTAHTTGTKYRTGAICSALSGTITETSQVPSSTS